MKITLLGAAGGEVTGSAYYVRTKNAAVLVDCGMFQGGRKAEARNRPPAHSRRKIDAVLVTHGHLDHVGRLPLLTKRGHQVPIFATPATIEMTALILRDSARIQVGDTKRRNRKRLRAGEPPIEPLYKQQDAEDAIACCQPVPYQKLVQVAPGIQAMWVECGHMLGSTSIMLLVDDEGTSRRIVFSGDLGPLGAPILRDFEPFDNADMVFLESTYGARNHRPFRKTAEEFIAIVQRAVKDGGKILVPTFAVGRAQLLTVLLGWMFRNRKVEPFPIFLDSPMAVEATRIYGKHPELFDEGMTKFLREKPLRQDLKKMKLCVTTDDSKEINDQTGPCLVMAGAGMCNAGRILHHLKANLWIPGTHVVIVGYQAYGSLGRQLVDGAKWVRIHREKIAVEATVHTLGGFSAHAGQKDLLQWLGALAPCKPRVVLTHGEDNARNTLAGLIRKRYRLASMQPSIGDTIEL